MNIRVLYILVLCVFPLGDCRYPHKLGLQHDTIVERNQVSPHGALLHRRTKPKASILPLHHNSNVPPRSSSSHSSKSGSGQSNKAVTPPPKAGAPKGLPIPVIKKADTTLRNGKTKQPLKFKSHPAGGIDAENLQIGKENLRKVDRPKETSPKGAGRIQPSSVGMGKAKDPKSSAPNSMLGRLSSGASAAADKAKSTLNKLPGPGKLKNTGLVALGAAGMSLWNAGTSGTQTATGQQALSAQHQGNAIAQQGLQVNMAAQIHAGAITPDSQNANAPNGQTIPLSSLGKSGHAKLRKRHIQKRLERLLEWEEIVDILSKRDIDWLYARSIERLYTQDNDPLADEDEDE